MLPPELLQLTLCNYCPIGRLTWKSC